MSPLEWCQWLQHTRFATAITESDWLFPVIEGSHILALPLSVGMIVIADLRLLGLAFCGEATGKVVPSFLRLSRIGFPVMFLTGVLLFITQAGKAYGNGFFRMKLIFLVLAAINAALYQKLLYPKMADWESAQGAPPGAKFCAAFSLVLWIGVIVCGRTMAYQF
jgi:hypothetical protein